MKSINQTEFIETYAFYCCKNVKGANIQLQQITEVVKNYLSV